MCLAGGDVGSAAASPATSSIPRNTRYGIRLPGICWSCLSGHPFRPSWSVKFRGPELGGGRAADRSPARAWGIDGIASCNKGARGTAGRGDWPSSCLVARFIASEASPRNMRWLKVRIPGIVRHVESCHTNRNLSCHQGGLPDHLAGGRRLSSLG